MHSEHAHQFSYLEGNHVVEYKIKNFNFENE